MNQTQTTRSNARSGNERIRGRHHGFDTEWSRERFAEVIRREVSDRSDRGWAFDRIWRSIRSLYELDERSSGKAVLEDMLGELRAQAKSEPVRSRSS